MSLRIFGNDPQNQPKPRTNFADDIVGRFRSGYQLNNRPAALTEWRVTTGDPEVAKEVFDLLGGDAPQEWEAKGEDNIEVFTASKEVEILIETPKSLRQKMVMWSRNGKLIFASDGQVIDYPEEQRGNPDPDADLTFAERKQKGRDGIGPEPQIELYFRLAGAPDLGIFKFQTGSWSMVSDLAYDDTEGKLEDAFEDSDGGPVKATLKIEEVSFVAKNGPRAGQTVSYNKPVLKVKGAA